MRLENRNPRGAAGVRKGASGTVRLHSIAAGPDRRAIPVGGPRWRRARGLETIADLALAYRMHRHPRGFYSVPLPADLVGGRWAA